MEYVNISAYLFVTINDREALRDRLRDQCLALDIKGTILLAPEGINLFLAGTRSAIDAVITQLRQDPRFAALMPKESVSSSQPFRRMLVRLKNEIITMRMPVIQPEQGRAPAVSAVILKRWLDQGHDDQGQPVVLLDTRNEFEVLLGTFSGALDYGIKKFTEFPHAVAQDQAQLSGKTVVTFCTGGIRCEKAAIYMRTLGLHDVYQLEGGILKYFEEVGGDHYQGDCFVFDARTALDPALRPAGAKTCFACRSVVTVEEQQSLYYLPGQHCPHCVTERQN
ncbi:MAG: sulfurtransferase [Ottowia sp.]|nr:sulfurtransferase [Ottowia sp.]